jgi:hypothetical protein
VLLPPRIQHDYIIRHQKGSERNVLGYHQVSRFRVIGDIPVGDVCSAIDPDGGDVGISDRGAEALVGDEDRRDLQAFGGAEYEILNLSGRRVRIDPDPQT